MGVLYSYECVGGKLGGELGRFGEKVLHECELQFVDEHGHALAPVVGAMVCVEEGRVSLVQYPEDFLPDDASQAEYDSWEKICDERYPGFEVYNDDELAGLLGV